MENNDEILLKQFFEENRQEVPDLGFSRRVMNRLPAHKARQASFVTSALTVALAITLFVVMDGVHLIGDALREVFGNISFGGLPSSVSGVEPWTLGVVFVVLLFMGYGKLANMQE